MPSLIRFDTASISEDTWELIDTENSQNGKRAIVPLNIWREESDDGLWLRVDAELDERFCNAPLIAIDFPAFTDGRGLSLAVLLRTRFAYKGELRAVGDVHPELLYYLSRCGFDSFLLPDSRSGQMGAQMIDSTFAPYSDYYQASVLEPDPHSKRIPINRRIRRLPSSGIIESFFLIFTGAAVLATVALYTRQPVLIAYIAIGCLLGPHGLKLVSDPRILSEIAEFGIIFLLFLVGLDLPPSKLKNMAVKTLLTALGSTLAFFLIGFALMRAFGFTIVESVVTGIAMTFSSTIIGIKLLPTTVLHHRHIGEIVVRSLIPINRRIRRFA